MNEIYQEQLEIVAQELSEMSNSDLMDLVAELASMQDEELDKEDNANQLLVFAFDCGKLTLLGEIERRKRNSDK